VSAFPLRCYRPTILSAMPLAEAVETTRIRSVDSHTGPTALVTTSPCQTPQTISGAGLIGRGQVLMPDGVPLTHNGVLFLDELLECRRHVLAVS
jgi:magnesium chelatase family protein